MLNFGKIDVISNVNFALGVDFLVLNLNLSVISRFLLDDDQNIITCDSDAELKLFKWLVMLL